METTKEDQRARVGNWTRNAGAKYETILILASLLAITLRYFNIAFGGILLVLSMASLGVFYFFSSYSSTEEETEFRMKIFVTRLSGWACSIAILGILFAIKNYPNSEMMLIIGSLTLIFALITAIYIRKRSPESQAINDRFIGRIVVIALIAVLLYFTPKQTLIDMKLLKAPNTANSK